MFVALIKYIQHPNTANENICKCKQIRNLCFGKNYEVTDTSVHNSQPLDDLLTEDASGQDFFAHSAYAGEEQEKVIDKYKMNNKVHEKEYRNKPLTDEQKANNKEKSKTRVRVEHVFGFTCLQAGRWNKA